MIKKLIALILIVLFILPVGGGCISTLNDITSRRGAVSGGAAGAGIGYAVNGWRGATIGAGVGISIGAIIAKIFENGQKQKWDKLPPDVQGSILGTQEGEIQAYWKIKDYSRKKSRTETYNNMLEAYGVPTK